MNYKQTYSGFIVTRKEFINIQKLAKKAEYCSFTINGFPINDYMITDMVWTRRGADNIEISLGGIHK